MQIERGGQSTASFAFTGITELRIGDMVMTYEKNKKYQGRRDVRVNSDGECLEQKRRERADNEAYETQITMSQTAMVTNLMANF